MKRTEINFKEINPACIPLLENFENAIENVYQHPSYLLNGYGGLILRWETKSKKLDIVFYNSKAVDFIKEIGDYSEFNTFADFIISGTLHLEEDNATETLIKELVDLVHWVNHEN